MWPSLKTASFIFDAASVVLFVSLVAGAISTGLIVWTGYVKEHHWDALRDAAREETQRLGAQTAKANADTARAHERIAELDAQSAEANARAQEAALELVRFRAPRLPTTDQLNSLIDRIKPFSGTKFDIGHGEDREQMDFLWRLEPALSSAGWVHIDWLGGDRFSKPNWPGGHTYGRVPSNNVSLEIHPQSEKQLRSAADALVEALNRIGISASVTFFNTSSMNVEAVHVLVGPKR